MKQVIVVGDKNPNSKKAIMSYNVRTLAEKIAAASKDWVIVGGFVAFRKSDLAFIEATDPAQELDYLLVNRSPDFALGDVSQTAPMVDEHISRDVNFVALTEYTVRNNAIRVYAATNDNTLQIGAISFRTAGSDLTLKVNVAASAIKFVLFPQRILYNEEHMTAQTGNVFSINATFKNEVVRTPAKGDASFIFSRSWPGNVTCYAQYLDNTEVVKEAIAVSDDNSQWALIAREASRP